MDTTIWLQGVKGVGVKKQGYDSTQIFEEIKNEPDLRKGLSLI